MRCRCVWPPILINESQSETLTLTLTLTLMRIEKGKAKQSILIFCGFCCIIDQPFPQRIQKLYYIARCNTPYSYRIFVEGVLYVKAKHTSTVWYDT